jgi:hypothetical protein
MRPTSRSRTTRVSVALAAVTALAAVIIAVPTGGVSAQGATEEYAFATFDAPDGNTITGELNGVGFTMESNYFGPTTVPDPITVTSCDLSGSSYSPAGAADAQCANTWARAAYEVTFDEPVEGLRIYFQGLRGEASGAGGSYEYDIVPNELECDEDLACWEIQSGLDGAEPYDPFDGYLVTTDAGLLNGVLFLGPAVASVSSFTVDGDAGELDISLMGVTFAVPAQQPEPTTTTTPGPTTTLPAGKPATPRFTG